MPLKPRKDEKEEYDAVTSVGSIGFPQTGIGGTLPSPEPGTSSSLIKKFPVAIDGVEEKEHAQALTRKEKAELEEAQKRVRQAQQEYAEYLKKNKAKFLEMEAKLETLSQLSALPLKFGRTKNLVIAEGWVPKEVLPELERKLNRDLQNVVRLEQTLTKETSPTMLDNPSLAQPFETLVKLFSTPKQDEIDPTLLVTISFPLFFGIMLGDVGYGFLGLLLALYLRYTMESKSVRDLANIMVLSSVSSMIFGVVFGEVFGKEEFLGMHIAPMIHRSSMEGTSTMIMLSLLIGLAHIFVGFLMGMINSLRHRHYKHALAKLSWIILELSGAFLLYTKMALPASGHLLGIPVAALDMASTALVAISLLGVIVLEGMIGGIEVFSLISNIFSYLRIMALGLSGAILAININTIPLDFDALAAILTGSRAFDAGVILAFVGFFVLFILGHALAFVLGIFESGVQALRLHYVEFFSKFYQGGGAIFSPLRKND